MNNYKIVDPNGGFLFNKFNEENFEVMSKEFNKSKDEILIDLLKLTETEDSFKLGNHNYWVFDNRIECWSSYANFKNGKSFSTYLKAIEYYLKNIIEKEQLVLHSQLELYNFIFQNLKKLYSDIGYEEETVSRKSNINTIKVIRFL